MPVKTLFVLHGPNQVTRTAQVTQISSLLHLKREVGTESLVSEGRAKTLLIFNLYYEMNKKQLFFFRVPLCKEAHKEREKMTIFLLESLWVRCNYSRGFHPLEKAAV